MLHRAPPRRLAQAVATLMLAALYGCDNGGSAVQTRDRSATPEVSGSGPAGQTLAAAPAEIKPAVTANRRETVDEKVSRLYQRNGTAFGARSAEDYLTRMKTFVETPPRGVETVRRPNGDTLYYQASTNTFAVAARDGTPRTMFKPDDGAAYWTTQKERAPTFGRRNATSAD